MIQIDFDFKKSDFSKVCKVKRVFFVIIARNTVSSRGKVKRIALFLRCSGCQSKKGFCAFTSVNKTNLK